MLLLLPPSRRLYPGSHEQLYLVDLDGVWESHLSLWCLGVQEVLQEIVELSTFPGVELTHQERETRALRRETRWWGVRCICKAVENGIVR